MKITRLIFFLLLFSLSTSGLMARELIDKIAAIVNDQVITLSELESQTNSLMRKLVPQGQASPPRSMVREKVLENMIAKKVQLQLAKKTGFRITGSEINATMQRLAENNQLSLEEFKREIEKEGITFQEFRQQISDEMMISQLRDRDVNRHVQLTDEEVKRFIVSERDRFFGDDEYWLEHLLIKRPKIADQIENARLLSKQTLEQARSGATFNDLIKKSDKKITGGDLGWKPLRSLPRAFSQYILTMNPGDISPVFETERGFHIIKLVQAKNDGIALENADILKKARQQLFQSKIEERGLRWLQQLVEEAYIVKRL